MQHPQLLHEKFDHFEIWTDNTQHVATRRNRVAKCAQHAATNNDEICYVERLLSFGQDSTLHIPFCLLVGRQVHISTILLVWRRLVVYAH